MWLLLTPASGQPPLVVWAGKHAKKRNSYAFRVSTDAQVRDLLQSMFVLSASAGRLVEGKRYYLCLKPDPQGGRLSTWSSRSVKPTDNLQSVHQVRPAHSPPCSAYERSLTAAV